MFAAARAAARAGHEVYLVSDAITAGRSRSLLSPGSATWVRVDDARPAHSYLTEGLSYADRVHDTLRRLHATRPLDVAEFVDTGGEALTVLRARRLLGEFAGTRVVVVPARSGPGGGGSGGGGPEYLRAASYPAMVTAFAEAYCRAYADASGPATDVAGVTAGPAGGAAGAAGRSGGGRPLVSVLIPLFNQGGYLAEALASVRRSGYRPVEIVVVDDGSTDPATVAAFDALTGVTRVRQRNAGLAAARNAGLARCRGRYVVPLDADDLLPPEFIGTAVAAMDRDPRLGYLSGYVHCFGLLDHVQVPVGPVPGLSLVLNTYARATGLFRRDALLGVGGWDPDLPGLEDWDLYLRLDAAGHPSDVLPVDGHRYRRHPDSMTFTAGAERRLDWLQHLLGKHAGRLTGEELVPLLQAVVHLWKTGYEPSASARLLARAPLGAAAAVGGAAVGGAAVAGGAVVGAGGPAGEA